MSDSNGPDPDLVPVRMLNEYVYCPRLAYLEWVQGEFVDSADTVEGRYRHRRVDREKGRLPEEDAEDADRVHARSVMLSAPELGLIARIDLVEAEGGRATPVDYKRGVPPDRPEGAWDPERVQVCAQGLILRENGFECDEGVLYFTGAKTRVRVPLDDELIALTLRSIDELRALSSEGPIPPPLEDSPKCPRCSLAGICLPDEVNLLAQIGAPTAPHVTHGDAPQGEPSGEVRRLGPAREERLPLYVTEQGASVGKSGDNLVVKIKGKPVAKPKLFEIGQIALLGNVQITAQCLREVTSRGIPVCHFTFGGWFHGITTSHVHKNVELRRSQFATAADAQRSLELARSFVTGKIRNQRTQLRRNHPGDARSALRQLQRLEEKSAAAESAESLLGFEGAAAKAYFSELSALIKVPSATFDFRGRNRRPPKDPVNALLSFGYAFLARDLTVTTLSVGLDPYLGFYHRPRYGRPALALDLAEELRPIVVDSAVLMAINNGEVRDEHFVRSAGSVALTSTGRRNFIAAYERRMEALVTHPVFGYPISYRKVLNVQARLLARFLTGEIGSYPAFCTR